VITGHQEKNRRGGTENVASIAGLGKACELAGTGMAACSAKLLALRERLENACLKIEGCKINGHPAHRLPNTCHASFEGVEGFELVVALDLEGICVSSGPACSTGAPDPSHVLRAMGLGPETAKGSLRISLGWGSTERDVDRLAAALPAAVRKLRKVRTA